MSQTKTKTAEYDTIAKPMETVSMDSHQENLEKRRAAREKNRKIQLACLDAEVAARHEAMKPVYDFEVKVTFRRPDSRGRMQAISETRMVSAKNDSEAWAKFCDSIGAWPSPHNCEVREIKQLAAA